MKTERDLGRGGDGRWSSARPRCRSEEVSAEPLVPAPEEPPARSQWQLFLPPLLPPPARRRRRCCCWSCCT